MTKEDPAMLDIFKWLVGRGGEEGEDGEPIIFLAPHFRFFIHSI